MADYFTALATSLGVSIWIIVLIMVWSGIWKAIALWKSARNEHLIWFIVFVIFNTMGILPILYIFIFSKMGKKKKRVVKKKK